LVSGAASGIGAAVADRLEQEGATVVRSDLVETDRGIVCDVSDPRSCAAAVDAVLSAHGSLHVLANVAGIGFSRRIGEVTPEEWRRVIDVNLTGTFLLSQAALPPLLDGRGVIVNMASVAGLRATPYNAAYCASKGGVIMLTKSMALELAAREYGSMQCARPRSTPRSCAASNSPTEPTWRCCPGRPRPWAV